MTNNISNSIITDAFIDEVIQRAAQRLRALSEQTQCADGYLTIQQAADVLHISPSRMYHIKDKYPYKRSGGKSGRILFRKEDLINRK